MSAETMAAFRGPAAKADPGPRHQIHLATEAADWPFRSYLEFGPLPTAISCARSHTRLVLREWGLSGLTDAVGLVVSELTTNALRACADLPDGSYCRLCSPGLPPIRFWLASDGERVLVQVWDASQQRPARQDPDLTAENGRGLQLVEAVSAGWGAFVPAGCKGKIVWAVIGEG